MTTATATAGKGLDAAESFAYTERPSHPSSKRSATLSCPEVSDEATFAKGGRH